MGGLAAAALLAHDGHTVTVYEKNAGAGGKMGERRSGDFRFDTGPSLVTMPELINELFERCGTDVGHFLEFVPLDPLCRYIYPDGTLFDNYQELERTLSEIRRIAPEDEEAYPEFLDYSRQLYEICSPAFLRNPLYDLSDLQMVNTADIFKIDALSTMSYRIDRFFSSSYLRRFFKRFATYNGSSPYRAPATLNVIPHIEISRGGYYVKGGIYRIAEALLRLAEIKGVRFHFETEIREILTDNDRVTGVRPAGGSPIASDLVVSNADASETYRHLLPDRAVSHIRKQMVERSEPSCSGFALLLGIDRTYDILKHHNVFFSDRYEREFEAIFEQKKPADDPTIYVANTSGTDPEHAVPGGSNLFVLVNAPYLTGRHDWEQQKNSYAMRIKMLLEQRGLEGLRKSIRFEEIISPADFYQRFRSNRGSIYGTSSNSIFSAFLRPGNKSRQLGGLYLAGGSTHPGGGIPLVLLSAMHVHELIGRKEIIE